jgi:hypothetical protein
MRIVADGDRAVQTRPMAASRLPDVRGYFYLMQHAVATVALEVSLAVRALGMMQTTTSRHYPPTSLTTTATATTTTTAGTNTTSTTSTTTTNTTTTAANTSITTTTTTAAATTATTLANLNPTTPLPKPPRSRDIGGAHIQWMIRMHLLLVLELELGLYNHGVVCFTFQFHGDLFLLVLLLFQHATASHIV